MESIEKKVTDAVLQRASSSIDIEGVNYGIAPPTPATLILVSEQIAAMPEVNVDNNNILQEVLRTAKDSSIIGKITAILILGAKRVREHRLVSVERPVISRRFSLRKFRFIKYTKKVIEEVEEVERLSELILENCTNGTISEVLRKRLIDMQVTDFFAITTSLSVANLLKPTKEVGTTAYGG